MASIEFLSDFNDGSIRMWPIVSDEGGGGKTLPVRWFWGYSVAQFVHRNNTVRFWDLHDAASKSHIIFESTIGMDDRMHYGCACIVFSPVGHQFVVGKRNGQIQLFSPSSENPCSPVKEITCTSVYSLTYSPDGHA